VLAERRRVVTEPTAPSRRDAFRARWHAPGPAVLVTGASRGIGRALALGLAARGARLGIIGRDAAALEETRRAIDERGATVHAALADVTKADALDAAADALADALGGLEGAVVNAGTTMRRDALETTPAEFRAVLDTNLTGAFLTARAFVRKCAHGGSVVVVGSTFATAAHPGRAAYAASKAALTQLARVLALEWAERGIRVNVVAPTATLSDGARAYLADPAIRRAMLERIPLGHLLEPEELVGAVAFLLSDDAAMITGAHLAVDGGYGLY